MVDCQHLTTHLTKDYDINDKDIMINHGNILSSHRNEASFALGAVGLEAAITATSCLWHGMYGDD